MPYKFEPKATKLDTKGLVREKTTSGEEATHEVQLYAVEALIPGYKNKYCVFIVTEEEYESYLKIKDREGISEDVKYEIFRLREARALARAVLEVNGATNNNRSHLKLDEIYTVETKTPYSHIGTAGLEFTIRFAYAKGVEGRISVEASSELGGDGPHLFYQSFGFEPGYYSDTPEELSQKKNKWNRQLNAAKEKAAGKPGRINTSGMEDTSMFLPAAVVAQKRELYWIEPAAVSIEAKESTQATSGVTDAVRQLTAGSDWNLAARDAIQRIQRTYIQNATIALPKIIRALGPDNTHKRRLLNAITNVNFQSLRQELELFVTDVETTDYRHTTGSPYTAYRKASAFLDQQNERMRLADFLKHAESRIEQIERAQGGPNEKLRNAFATVNPSTICDAFAEVKSENDERSTLSDLADAFLKQEFLNDAQLTLKLIEKNQGLTTNVERRMGVARLKNLINTWLADPLAISQAFKEEAGKANLKTGFFGMSSGGKSSFRDQANGFLVRYSGYIENLNNEKKEQAAQPESSTAENEKSSFRFQP